MITIVWVCFFPFSQPVGSNFEDIKNKNKSSFLNLGFHYCQNLQLCPLLSFLVLFICIDITGWILMRIKKNNEKKSFFILKKNGEGGKKKMACLRRQSTKPTFYSKSDEMHSRREGGIQNSHCNK